MARTKRPSKTAPKRDLHQQITERIIKQLENGVIPWRPGWQGVPDITPLRHNDVPYNGINALILWAAAASSGFEQPRWMTYNQAQELGGQVRRGETSETVVYTSTYTPKGADPDDANATVRFLKAYNVFNVSQIDDLPERYVTEVKPLVRYTHEPIPHIDQFIENTGARVRTNDRAKALYSPSQDVIEMPELHRFETAENYYKTLCHELVHWTGHHSRLKRETGARSRVAYSMEELVAELGSAFLAAQFQMKMDFEADSAAYINSWINVLKADNRLLFNAAAKASKSVAFLNDAQPETNQEAA